MGLPWISEKPGGAHMGTICANTNDNDITFTLDFSSFKK